MSYGLYDKNSTQSSNSKFDTLGSPKEQFHLSAEKVNIFKRVVSLTGPLGFHTK